MTAERAGKRDYFQDDWSINAWVVSLSSREQQKRKRFRNCEVVDINFKKKRTSKAVEVDESNISTFLYLFIRAYCLEKSSFVFQKRLGEICLNLGSASNRDDSPRRPHAKYSGCDHWPAASDKEFLMLSRAL